MNPIFAASVFQITVNVFAAICAICILVVAVVVFVMWRNDIASTGVFHRDLPNVCDPHRSGRVCFASKDKCSVMYAVTGQLTLVKSACLQDPDIVKQREEHLRWLSEHDWEYDLGYPLRDYFGTFGLQDMKAYFSLRWTPLRPLIDKYGMVWVGEVALINIEPSQTTLLYQEFQKRPKTFRSRTTDGHLIEALWTVEIAKPENLPGGLTSACLSENEQKIWVEKILTTWLRDKTLYQIVGEATGETNKNYPPVTVNMSLEIAGVTWPFSVAVMGITLGLVENPAKDENTEPLLQDDSQNPISISG